GRIMSLDIEAMAAAVTASVQQTADQLIGEIRGTALEDCMSCLEASSGLLAGLEWAANTPALSTDADCLAYLRQFASFMLTTTGTVRTKVDVRQGFPAKNPLTKKMNELLGLIRTSGEAETYARALQVLATLPDTLFPERSANMCRHLTV